MSVCSVFALSCRVVSCRVCCVLLYCVRWAVSRLCVCEMAYTDILLELDSDGDRRCILYRCT